MSRENVELVRAVWTAYSRGDFDASLEGYAEDSVWDDREYRPDGAIHVGRDALVQLARTWRGTWEDYRLEIEDLRDGGGDRVAVILSETGRGKGGGIELTNRWGLVVTVRRGKVAHTFVYRQPEAALEAVGLRQ